MDTNAQNAIGAIAKAINDMTHATLAQLDMLSRIAVTLRHLTPAPQPAASPPVAGDDDGSRSTPPAQEEG